MLLYNNHQTLTNKYCMGFCGIIGYHVSIISQSGKHSIAGKMQSIIPWSLHLTGLEQSHFVCWSCDNLCWSQHTPDATCRPVGNSGEGPFLCVVNHAQGWTVQGQVGVKKIKVSAHQALILSCVQAWGGGTVPYLWGEHYCLHDLPCWQPCRYTGPGLTERWTPLVVLGRHEQGFRFGTTATWKWW